MGNGSTERYVINLFGQYSDKQPMMPYAHDNWGLRYLWFNQGLDKIYKIKDLESVAFNYKIGCGLGIFFLFFVKFVDFNIIIINF